MKRRVLILCAAVAGGVYGAGACAVDAPVTSPVVTVQRLRATPAPAGAPPEAPAGCWQTLWSNDLQGGCGLGLSDFCPASVCAVQAAPACPLAGGSDELRVLVDYSGVPLTPSATPPAPAVTETLDGVGVDAGAAVAAVPGASPSVYMATLPVPPEAGSSMLLGVGVAPGYSYQIPQPFAVEVPPPDLDVAVCGQDTCLPMLFIGSPPVGLAQITATIPGASQGAVTVTTTMKLGGGGGGQPSQPTATYTVQANEPAMVTSALSCGAGTGAPAPGLAGTLAVPTPIPPVAGSTWSVCASWGGSAATCKDVPLTPFNPTIELDYADGAGLHVIPNGSCDGTGAKLSPVPAAPGSDVTLRVTAPPSLLLRTVTVSTVIDGAPCPASGGGGAGGAAGSADAGAAGAGGAQGGSPAADAGTAGACAGQSLRGTLALNDETGKLEAVFPLAVPPSGLAWEIDAAVGPSDGTFVTSACFALPSGP
jgi:hypothetical protein